MTEKRRGLTGGPLPNPGLERTNNIVGKLVHRDQGRADGQASTWPFYAERYTRGVLEVHLHLWSEFLAEHGTEMSNYCAVFQSAHGKSESLDLTMAETLDVDVPAGKAGMGEVYSPVFVMVRDFVKKPKRVKVWRPVRSIVRLNTLDVCLGIDGETFNLSEATSGSRVAILLEFGVPLAVKEDRELGLVVRSPMFHSGDGDEVVKPRSQVIEAVADNNTPFWWQWPQNPQSDDALGMVRLEVEDWVVRVVLKEGLDLPPQRLKVFCRSVELEDAGEGGVLSLHGSLEITQPSSPSLVTPSPTPEPVRTITVSIA